MSKRTSGSNFIAIDSSRPQRLTGIRENISLKVLKLINLSPKILKNMSSTLEIRNLMLKPLKSISFLMNVMCRNFSEASKVTIQLSNQ